MGEEARSQEVSRILREAGEGRPVDMNGLLPLVYDQLHAIASRRMATERKDHTLQASALVHEAYLKLVGQEHLDWGSKARFFSAAADAMRRILIDHARTKGRAKRGGKRRRMALDVVDLARRDDTDEILSVDEALRRLEEQDPRMAEIVKLRFYAGLSVKEVALSLGVTERTVYREWLMARTWLEQQLGEE